MKEDPISGAFCGRVFRPLTVHITVRKLHWILWNILLAFVNQKFQFQFTDEHIPIVRVKNAIFSENLEFLTLFIKLDSSEMTRKANISEKLELLM